MSVADHIRSQVPRAEELASWKTAQHHPKWCRRWEGARLEFDTAPDPSGFLLAEMRLGYGADSEHLLVYVIARGEHHDYGHPEGQEVVFYATAFRKDPRGGRVRASSIEEIAEFTVLERARRLRNGPSPYDAGAPRPRTVQPRLPGLNPYGRST